MPADGVDANKAKPEKRVALVIGNGAYANATPLGNPPNDARAMAAMLRGLDFEVVEDVDAMQFLVRRGRCGTARAVPSLAAIGSAWEEKS